MEQQEPSFTADEIQNGAATLEASLAVSYKLKILLPYLPCDSTIALLGIYTKELKFTSTQKLA